MDAVVMVLSGAAAALLVWTLVGGPMVLADRVRTRRQAVIARQIALTDALDAQFGALVAPVVTKPVFGPWEVRIAVPPLGAAVFARMIAAADAVFAGIGEAPSMRYRLVVRDTPTSGHAVLDCGVRQSAQPWPASPVTAA